MGRILRMAVAMALAGQAGTIAAAPMTPARSSRIDAAVHAGMTRVGAQGMALAVIEEGRPVLIRAYGLRSRRGDPLRTDTIMYGASLTKAVVAYTVLRLVDEGRIDLDRPIAAMLSRPLPDYGNLDAYGNWGDLAGDERWRRITPRMVLSHSTGFANFAWLEPDQKLRIHFEPGTRYGYSGTGMMLLQFGIEQGLGLDLQRETQRLTFGPLGMRNSSLIWRPDFASHVADAWRADGSAWQHDQRERVRAAGSMDTTIQDMARFAAAIVSGTHLSARGHGEQIRPQRAITTASQFPTLQPELPPARRWRNLAAGLGVITFTGPQGPGFSKGGHDDQTANNMVCIERGRRCVVLLGNDVRVEPLFPEIVRAVLGETGVPWQWEYGAPN